MREMYKNILVGLDGSPQAENALKEAVEAAKRNQARLFLIQIIDDSQYLLNSAIPVGDLVEEEEKRAQAYLINKIAEIDFPNASAIVKVGNPKRLLTQEIPEEYKIDLIYLGATGKGRLERIWVGSVANYVVNHAPCNVMIVRE